MVVTLRGGTRRPRHHHRVRDRPAPLLPRRLRNPSPDGQLLRSPGLRRSKAAAPAGFADTGGDTHEANIDALAAAGITTGCETDPLRYCPDQPVTRAQMATFLHRALLAQKEQVTEPEPVTISDDVPDVDLVDISTGETVKLPLVRNRRQASPPVVPIALLTEVPGACAGRRAVRS